MIIIPPWDYVNTSPLALLNIDISSSPKHKRAPYLLFMSALASIAEQLLDAVGDEFNLPDNIFFRGQRRRRASIEGVRGLQSLNIRNHNRLAS